MDVKKFLEATKVSSKKVTGGIEVYIGRKRIYTIVELGGCVRLVYPKGGEYTHTSMYGQKLTDALVEKLLFSVAFGVASDYKFEMEYKRCRWS